MRDQAAGGYRVDYIYRSDPDYPDERSPLADPDLGIVTGEVIVGANLFQSAFTNWCPMMTMLRKLGARDTAAHGKTV